jgi:type IV secretory pathway VirB10-like protein
VLARHPVVAVAVPAPHRGSLNLPVSSYRLVATATLVLVLCVGIVTAMRFTAHSPQAANSDPAQLTSAGVGTPAPSLPAPAAPALQAPAAAASPPAAEAAPAPALSATKQTTAEPAEPADPGPNVGLNPSDQALRDSRTGPETDPRAQSGSDYYPPGADHRYPQQRGEPDTQRQDAQGMSQNDGMTDGQGNRDSRRQMADALCDRYHLPRQKCEQAASRHGH